MSTGKFTSFHVKRYRSLLDVKIAISDNSPVIVCGENNVGKTNLLRALNVFFNHPFQDDLFHPEMDIPHHIFYGSRGSSTKTEMTCTFENDGNSINLKVVFDKDGVPTYTLDQKSVDDLRAREILSEYQFLFVESHNVDLPKLISVVLEKDGLLPLDTKRAKQSKPLEKLTEFIELSQKAISDIERDINQYFERLTDFDGVLQGKKIGIKFAEFEKLRDVVKTMTLITLHDGNTHGIASKGSGAQRAVFLALMQFISQNSKRNIIWGVDEPEAFLQPRLQKKVAAVFHEIVSKKNQPVILTTHSQHFVRLNDLKTTHIFEGTVSEREYARKPDQKFYEVSTKPIACKSDFEKAILIKRHLGISNNDGWEVLPYNILVEGEEDKKYLETMLTMLDLPSPNIVWSGGAAKIAGYLQYYNLVAKDLPYKPEFVCIFDNDLEGREQAKKILSYYPYISVKIADIPRHDGTVNPTKLPSLGDWEIEDFLPPDIVLRTINTILKQEKYKPITKSQISNRAEPAHRGKQILKYAEECVSQNNPNKEQLLIDVPGRKRQICQKFCEQALNYDSVDLFSEVHKKFLTEIAK